MSWAAVAINVCGMFQSVVVNVRLVWLSVRSVPSVPVIATVTVPVGRVVNFAVKLSLSPSRILSCVGTKLKSFLSASHAKTSRSSRTDP